MAQLMLHFGQRVEQGRMTGFSPLPEKHVPFSSLSFDFNGRGIPQSNYRKGQFQYRWGVKVCPKDETL